MAWMIINLLFGTCRRAGIRVLRTPVFTLDKAMPVLRRTFKGREMKKKTPPPFLSTRIALHYRPMALYSMAYELISNSTSTSIALKSSAFPFSHTYIRSFQLLYFSFHFFLFFILLLFFFFFSFCSFSALLISFFPHVKLPPPIPLLSGATFVTLARPLCLYLSGCLYSRRDGHCFAMYFFFPCLYPFPSTLESDRMGSE